MAAVPLSVVLLDIEGTTTPISFVHRVLFPFARSALPALLRERSAEPEIAAALAAFGSDPDPLARLLGYMDEDRKDPALKLLQGI
ncbi:MAG: acireductone synthase, partial [Gluconacetobacter diazotrophicus]|nr:acireductone synthase [Gluconacetobacter diazotrophicus]